MSESDQGAAPSALDGDRAGAGSGQPSYADYLLERSGHRDDVEPLRIRAPDMSVFHLRDTRAVNDPPTEDLFLGFVTAGTGDASRCDFARGRFRAPTVPGTFVVAPPRTTCLHEGGGLMDLMVIAVTGSAFAGMREELGMASPGAFDALYSRAWKEPRVAALVWRLWSCADELAEPHSRLILDGGATMLVGELARLASRPRPDPKDSSRLPGPVLDRVVEYLHAHLHEPIGVEELAGIAGCTRYHFSRLFRQSVGESPSRWVTRLRVERASVLLSTTGLGVDAVAQRVGFADRSGLARAFRTHRGVVPGRGRLQG